MEWREIDNSNNNIIKNLFENTHVRIERSRASTKKTGVEMNETADNPGDLAFTLASALEYDFRNFAQARLMYEKAVAEGHKLAQFNLGLWHLDGNRPGTKKNLVKAKELFQASAEQGVGISMYNLGTLYEAGEGGLPKDEVAAFKLYKRAIKEGRDWPEDGKRRVYTKLSQMYQSGTGTARDLQKAAKWMEKASEEQALPPEIMKMMKMLQMLDPGKHQADSDDNWRRMSKFIDELPEEEKPTTYRRWEEVFLKFGYVPSCPKIRKTKKKNKTCNFSEFMELSGGSFNTLDDFEMQDSPVPRPICAFCKVQETKERKLKNCARCCEKYCSKECQRKDWKDHKKICDLVHDQIGL